MISVDGNEPDSPTVSTRKDGPLPAPDQEGDSTDAPMAHFRDKEKGRELPPNAPLWSRHAEYSGGANNAPWVISPRRKRKTAKEKALEQEKATVEKDLRKR